MENPLHPQRGHSLVGPLSWIVLAAILIQAAVLRSQLSPVAIGEHDSWGWLGSALGWLSGNGFHEVYEREWLYSAFVAGALRWIGSFSGLVTLQQSLGLVGGALAFATWRAWTGTLGVGVAAEAVISFAGLGVVAMNLFDAHLLLLELGIRPEAIMVPVAFAQLLCITLYARYRWQIPRLARAVGFGSLAAVLAYALYVLKPNWALAVPLTLLPLFAGMFAVKRLFSGWQVWAVRGIPITGAFLTGLLVWFPGHMLFQPSGETRLVLPMTLFTIHADVIAKSMEQRLKDDPSDKQLAVMLPVVQQELHNAREQKIYYRRLGFDPDYLMYRSPIFPVLESRFGATRDDLKAFCIDSYREAWLTHPTGMLNKILVQFDCFLRPDPTTFTRKKYATGKIYAYVDASFAKSLGTEYSPAIRGMFGQWRGWVVRAAEENGIVRSNDTFFKWRSAAASFVPWITAAFLIALASTLLPGGNRSLMLGGGLSWVYWMAPAGNALTVAVAHALDNSRYRLSYGGLLFFAVGTMTVFLLLTISRRLLRGSVRSTDKEQPAS